MSDQTDLDLSHGFDAGNYAQAHETDDYETAIAGLDSDVSTEYADAFTLGFFSSCSLAEMSDPDAFEEAYARVAPRMIELGIAVEREDDAQDDAQDD